MGTIGTAVLRRSVTAYDATVVGGGIVGTAAAYHLARDGRDVLLVDREDEGRATDAGAGIVSAATSSRSDDGDWFRLGVAAERYYPTLAEQLADDQDGDVGYSRPGLLSVAVDADEAVAAERSLARVRDRQERYGVPPDGTVTELSPEGARARCPALGSVERAVHYETAGRVDGRTFADALRRAARAHGLDVRRAAAEGVRVEAGRVTAVEVDGDPVETDAAVVAGGAWSAAFADDLDCPVPVEPQRGQIAHLSTDAATGDWPVVSAHRGHYLVPWPGGRVAAGATREDGAGFDPRTTAAGVREVLAEATRVAPGLGDAALAEVRVGLRPASPDGLPVLGAVPGVDGAYLATGHGPTGLTLGPYSGKQVARLVAGREPAVDLAAFSPARF